MSETIQVLYGMKELEPVKYWIEKRETGPRWWRRTEYFLKSEFGTLGPFESAAEIMGYARQAGIEIVA